MASIQLLPSHLIKQIAAGECIERPASVIKELVENSLDAGAGRIEIHVEDAGNRLIRIIDDGCGIAPEELPLALTSHATSKIHTTDELMAISTLGFRGEALASISSVAELTLTSASQKGGHTIEAAGESISDVRPAGCARGTVIEVRNLFFNVPARRKFLKSNKVEMGHISDAVIRLALSDHNVSFELKHNNRHMFVLAKAKKRGERIRDAVGSGEIEFLEHSGQIGASRLQVYLARPEKHRANNKWQYFYINGRYIKDRVLLRSLADAYKEYLPERRHPIAVCYLTIDPAWVDINVHPAKYEVRFRDQQQIYRLVHSTVAERLARERMIPELSIDPAPSFPAPVSRDLQPETQKMKPAKEKIFPPAQEKQENKETKPSTPSEKPKESWPQAIREMSGSSSAKQELHSSPLPIYNQTAERPVSPVHHPPSQEKSQLQFFEIESNCQQVPGPFLQVHNSYLVVEDSEGILIIDQHALHERVLYDRLRRQLKSKKIIFQPLLFPEPLSLLASEMAVFEQWQDKLREIGIETRILSSNQIEILQLPQILGKMSAIDFVGNLIEQLSKSQQMDLEDSMDDILASMACKAAVKAGDSLDPKQILSLLKACESADQPFHCPHGRPAYLKLSLKKLAKHFGRT